ncbi:unnamed protein product [Clonostachys rosea]|uniref:Major facilitator superfamily (MFS) profile domain-containing protein n=1 Tax=Bionectria ochroleuca TaxID=29856 RepID=A0ABY6TXF2_BIOOC|nr:unnamed protein product [Clonostachys rosea]
MSFLGNARLANFETDLSLTGYDYNAVLSAFYISYILLEIPANIACKWVGPGWFLPLCTIGFGICSLCNAFVQNIHSASAVRFLLGAFEAGLLPGLSYYLSRWYRRSELVFRISLFVVAAPLAGAFGGLLSSAILKLPHFGSLHSWRIIFAIEGLVTIAVGLVSLFALTDRPETARWLSQDEKALAIARVQSERIGVTEVLEQMNFTRVVRGIVNPSTIAVSIIFLLNNITVQGLSIFAPTIIKTIYPQHSIISQQLYTAPLYVSGAAMTMIISFMSWKSDQRLVFVLVCAPFMVCGYVMFLATTNPHTRYAATFLIAAGAFPFGALCNAQVAVNVISDTAQASAIATNVMFGNLGGLVSTWSYLTFDAPNYHIGNGLNLASSSTIIIITVLLRFWMDLDNRRRNLLNVDAGLASHTRQQIRELDWRHPAFRWRP